MEEVIDIRTLQCYQKATEEQRKKCTSKLSFEIGKLPTLKLQEEWTFYTSIVESEISEQRPSGNSIF